MTGAATVGDYMVTDLVTVTPDTDIHHAIRMLLERQLSGLPVVDEAGEPVGFLSSKDCLKIAFGAAYHQDGGGRVSAFMSHRVHTIPSNMDIVEAADILLKTGYRRLPVVAEGRLVGVISRYEVLRALEDLW
jgi:CBS domain-containing protein